MLKTFMLIGLLLLAFEREGQAMMPEQNLLGGWSGNGGNIYQMTDNVWFLGEEPIRYCLRPSPNYPLSTVELRDMVAEAFASWWQFFQRYQIGEPGQPFAPFSAKLPQLSMTLAAKEVDCSQSPELEIYFGDDNQTLQVYRQLHEDNGLGLALRRSYNHQSHRNFGYIWLAAFTSEKRKLQHLLLHELGHIFGMKHDSVFVMDRDIALTLKSIKSDDPAFAYLGKVEADFWPFDLNPGGKVSLQPFARQIQNSPIGYPHPSNPCRGDSVPLQQIPYEFHPFPGGAQPPCIRVSLQKLHVGTANNFQLLMHSENGHWLATIYGSFSPSLAGNEKTMVPGTLSSWSVTSKEVRDPWIFVPYGQNSMHALQSGYFIRGQIRFPAKISWSRGLTLEIFIPQQGRWWTIRSFSDLTMRAG
ncbi:MAG: hypothetical protein ACOH5I_23380 [Oligoflexus sp.]